MIVQFWVIDMSFIISFRFLFQAFPEGFGDVYACLVEKKVPENNTEEVKKLLFNCIDLTTLNSTDSDESVMHFTEKVNEFDNEFPDMKNVAAIYLQCILVLEGNFPFHPAVIPFKEFWRADKIRGQIIHGLANRLRGQCT